MKRFLKLALAAGVLALGSAAACAANVSFTGTLADDNDVRLFTFTLAADADVSLRTWSYAGGTNAAGSLIGAGGFDPIVSVFAGLGDGAVLIGDNDDGTGVATDPASGHAYDSLLEFALLPAGTYTVALTEFNRFADGSTLGDGFRSNDISGFDGRTSAWALDILGVDDAARIPEPATLALGLLALVAMRSGAATRRSRSGHETGIELALVSVARRTLAPCLSNG